MSPPVSPRPKPRPFILDFDGTITTKDTISTLFRLAISKQASLGHDFTKAHEFIISNYTRDFSHHLDTYRPAKQDRHTLSEEIDYYRSLHPIEVRSFNRVSDSGIFGGVAEKEWGELGENVVKDGDVVVRTGFRRFREEVERLEGGVWGIVSVNFSRGFVRGVVEAAGGDVDGVQILTNASDEKGVLQGPKFDGSNLNGQVIATSNDKLAAMKALLRLWKNAESLEKSRLDAVRPIYIGDSGTDIECLAEDDIIGIIMRLEEPSNTDWVGFELLHIQHFKEAARGSKTIYWARDFLEILDSPLLR